MPILYLVYDGNKVTGALDMSVLSNIFNRSSTCQITIAKPNLAILMQISPC